MKKFLAAAIGFVIFASMLPMAASAQSYCRKDLRNARTNYRGPVYRNASYTSNRRNIRRDRVYRQQRPSVYRRHRNLINIGIGTGGGAIIGGLVGGKRGAAWGALAGAGASALYTYKISPKKRRYYRR